MASRRNQVVQLVDAVDEARKPVASLEEVFLQRGASLRRNLDEIKRAPPTVGTVLAELLGQAEAEIQREDELRQARNSAKTSLQSLAPSAQRGAFPPDG